LTPLRPIKYILLACALFLLASSDIAFSSSPSLSITGKSEKVLVVANTDKLSQSLNEFVRTVINGDPNTVVGIYVPGIFALPVLQQQADDSNYVSKQPNTLTQFAAASQFGTKGFLAHNYLSGAQFFQISVDKVFYLVYGDGTIKPYIVSSIERYQALQPDSLSSNFIDLQNSGTVLSARDIFNRIYTNGDKVVFQTCIEKGGKGSWGRIFIIASPYLSPISNSIFDNENYF
jgi:hypothetical protein